jgi:Ni/Fe-hydrogenase subunit HybB-like protein
MKHAAERPLGGRIFTPGFIALVALIVAGVLLVLYRLFFGLGAVSAMNDSYPWGIWKPFNVVTLTGIAAGAYAVGMLTYIFNHGEYHPLVRSAIVAGAMGYTLAGTSVLIDLGRWWNLWVVFYPPVYNMNSVLLEVAICVMAYCIVLWIEVSPAVLEHWARAASGRLKHLAVRLLPPLKAALPFIVSLAILLPTMHQSSLGGLYMVTVTKLHPLWHTGWVSALFLLSCLTMGFGAVVIIENATDLAFHRRMNQKLLARMAVVPAALTFAYLALRFEDLAFSDKLHLLAKLDFYTAFFWLEIALFAVPAVMLVTSLRRHRGWLFLASILLVLAGAFYRFDTYLTAYMPVSGGKYFPSLGEILLSMSLVAAGIAVYVLLARSFPILSGVLARRSRAAGPAGEPGVAVNVSSR